MSDDVIANRYRLVRAIGTGGMATVHEVVDETTGSSLALKQLSPEASGKPSAALLFRREYATLAQLAHPLIIRAYDYGVDRDRPYYTMERVQGENLRACGCLTWKEACFLLRDVASALAAVHTRRLVHRDVTAANVCRTQDGRAKLLDFGALAPMGVALDLVGTAPFVAPECLDGQPLDGRSDLFSLGALAYLLLTGNHAYPAHRLSDLRSAWLKLLDPPGMRIPGIPESLDTLVMSLLSLNPLARPRSAAEVFERLTVIADLPTNEDHDVAQSYLLSPALVARGHALQRFRRRLSRAQNRKGAALLIEGDPGLGRSRLLQSFLTEAKLNGMIALYADAKRGSEPFAVTRALARRLVETDPSAYEVVQQSPAFERLSLNGARDEEPREIPSAEWPDLVDAVTAWFVTVSSKAPLAIGVDDFENSDAPSILLLAKLAEAAPSRRLLVIGTAELGARGAVEGFRSVGGSLVLHRFRSTETRALLASVFGDVPHLDATAQWVHQVAEGNPRTALELAQHLVDRGIVRFEQASWVLPRSLDALTLPESLDQALDAKVAALSPGARGLAETFALTIGNEPAWLREYAFLFPEGGSENPFPALSELVAASVLESFGSAYVFANKDIKQALDRGISEERRPEIHRRLARVYRNGANGAEIYAVHHLFCAGDEGEAFSLFVKVVSERTGEWRRGLDFARTSQASILYERMFEYALDRGVSPVEFALVGRVLLQLAAVAHSHLAKHAPTILDRFRKDAGLLHWDEFEHVRDPLERVRSCVARAYADRGLLAESEQGLEPARAIQEFAVCTGMLAAVCGRTRDAPRVVELLQWIEPLRPLSPATEVLANVVAYTANAARGRPARHLRLRVLEQVAEPVPGIEEVTRRGIRLITTYYQALEEATFCDPDVHARIEVLEEDPAYAPLLWQVRAIAHLYKGEEKHAENCRRKRDLALVGRSDVNRHIDLSVVNEAMAYVMLDDLMGLRRVLGSLRTFAEKWPGWRATHLVVESAYRALRGDLPKALELAEQAEELSRPELQWAWSHATIRIIHLLLELGRPERARERAEAAASLSKGVPLLAHYRNQLEMAFALAEARGGSARAALVRANEIVATAEDEGASGIHLLDLMILQARIAREAGANLAYDSACRRINAACSRVDSVAFTTKLANLLHVSPPKGFEAVATAVTSLSNYREGPSALAAKVRSELDVCRGAHERAKRTLELLLEHSGTDQGYLYLNQPEGLSLAASRAQAPPPLGLEDRLAEWIDAADDDHDTGSMMSATGSGDSSSDANPFAFLKVTADSGGQVVLTAVAVLDCRRRYPMPIAPSTIAALGQTLLESGDAVI